MPYNSVADGFHTKKLRNRLYSREMHISNGKRPFCVLRGWLGATCTVHLRLIGKRVVDLLLVVLIELFFGSCYGCGATNESQNQRIWYKNYGIRFSCCHNARFRQTDRHMSTARPCVCIYAFAVAR